MAQMLGVFFLGVFLYKRQRVDCPVGPRQEFGIDRDAFRDRGGDVPLISEKAGLGMHYDDKSHNFANHHPEAINPRLFADGSCKTFGG